MHAGYPGGGGWQFQLKNFLIPLALFDLYAVYFVIRRQITRLGGYRV